MIKYCPYIISLKIKALGECITLDMPTGICKTGVDDSVLSIAIDKSY